MFNYCLHKILVAQSVQFTADETGSFSIEVTSDKWSLPGGIRVGMSRAEIGRALFMGTNNGSGLSMDKVSYDSDGYGLDIEFKNGIVTKISYWYEIA